MKIKIDEKDLQKIIKESIIKYINLETNKKRIFKYKKLISEKNDKNNAYGVGVRNEYLYENINEGLIMSYDINKSAEYLKKKYPNIKNIRSLKFNPYQAYCKPKKNDFVAIDLGTNFENYKEIINTIQTLLGWFVSEIDIKEKAKGGYKERTFYNFNGKFLCNDIENDFKNYLSKQKIISFSMIIEAKFGKKYQQKTNEIFYHGTEKKYLKRIMKYGLIPKAFGNFPERIYLGKSIEEIKIMKGNLSDLVILKINANGLNLYEDERNDTAYYTYDNIPPQNIIEITMP